MLGFWADGFCGFWAASTVSGLVWHGIHDEASSREPLMLWDVCTWFDLAWRGLVRCLLLGLV